MYQYDFFKANAKRIEEIRNNTPLNKQVSGDHYKSKGIQPIEYIMANELGFLEGNVIKYVTRHKDKNGEADIDKAIHYLEFIKHYYYGKKDEGK